MDVEMFAKPDISDSFEIFRRFPFVFAPFCPEFLSGRFGRRSPGDILHIFFPIAFSLAIRVTVMMTIMTTTIMVTIMTTTIMVTIMTTSIIVTIMSTSVMVTIMTTSIVRMIMTITIMVVIIHDNDHHHGDDHDDEHHHGDEEI